MEWGEKKMGRPKTKIEVHSDFDDSDNVIYIVEKAKGRLTIEEIKKALKEYEEDFYFLLIDCLHDEDECYQGWNEDIDDKNKGDRVIAYPADRLLKKCNSEKAADKIESTINEYYEEMYKNE